MVDEVSFRVAGSTLHASCVARGGKAVLILGPSGSGKSDLALRLMDRGFALVADDRVRLRGGMAEPPETLRGLIEVRGVGIVRVPPVFPLPVALVVRLSDAVPRLPEPVSCPVLGAALDLPAIALSAWETSAVLKVEIALDCVLGNRTLETGFTVQSM
ncbi:HPr kinase/phosphatase C-terminal domain-containing protein [Acetobacteraceae bacterium KSS8]|uniref:HPr kinase/phosphatase C-terminal domain-containing protein n=1 Tax=Endosaccharibacter trunci TaxID=2812733 RepID=A0ABT1W6E4_9PROT|nr:HPr kinase/phosphatase C-terminal domain-containing protein [Acetobacteraceae bacterium KSS8]